MGKGPRTIWLIGVGLLLAACGSNLDSGPGQGPVLVQDSTLPSATAAPTRFLSPTPQVSQQATSEVLSPLNVVTIDADFVLVTPTLPASKTPTSTPTVTRTPTESPTPTSTVTATATAPQFPTSVVQPITAMVPNPLPQVCDSTWFFSQPRPDGCPLAAPLTSQGVFQSFENGYMIWVGSQDAIYVLYNDALQPRWEVYRDQFNEGMAEEDPAFANAPRPNLWQPRRGFGMLWRGNSGVRNRIGWATDELEIPYSVQVQTSANGTLFLSEPGQGVFAVLPGGQTWARYAGFVGP